MTIVYGSGRLPNEVLLCGEAPGFEEASVGKPFVGRSGREQDWYLSRYDLTSLFWYKTNVVKQYIDGNPDPTPELIDEWTPFLLQEIEQCRPKLIVAVGRFAARWFLGESVEMDIVHGLPHKSGAFDGSRSNRGPNGCIVVPVYHPAAGFYDNDLRALIAWDYSQVADTLQRLKSGRSVDTRTDEHEGSEIYLDVSGQELSELVTAEDNVIAIDTEGRPDNPWSLQVSDREGFGYTLRRDREDFGIGVDHLKSLSGVTVVMHNAMYDLEMCRVMGLDLFDCNLFDTMYAAYLLRLEPQGLKALGWRWCGCQMMSHDELTSELGTRRQLEYLELVLATPFDPPEPRLVKNNDGTSRVYKPQHVHRRASKIKMDVELVKVDKDGNPVDPIKRWQAVDKELRRPVERVLGEMPIGSVGAVFEVDPDRAINYASRDSDVTYRLYWRLKDKVPYGLMHHGMDILPVFEEMQSSGIPASRSKFIELRDSMQEKMDELQAKISTEYFNSKPFNPNSPMNVRSLLKSRGLSGEKFTGTGEVSTSKDSIEHLRYSDEAMALVFDWREHEHIKSAFAEPILDHLPDEQDNDDVHLIRCQIKPTRVHTRRLATANPNLLAIPTRTDVGRKVREAFVCGKDEVFGSWDLSQIEMRVMAHESRDTLLCQLFDEGRDVHTETASRIFSIPIDQVDQRKHRRPSKDIGFGVLFGIQPPGLQVYLRKQDVYWTVDQCGEMIERWLSVYSGVSKYIDKVTDELKGTGIVKDHWGMVRYLPSIWSVNDKDRAEAGRIAVNHKIQGGAQGMIQNSIRWLKPKIRELQRSGLNVHWVLTIHDEVLLRFDEWLWDLMNELVLEALTKHCGVELRVPVLAEGKCAKSWGNIK